MAAIIGGISLGWFGVQTARETRHVDLEATPSRRRLVGVFALAIGSIGIGLILAMVV